MIDTDELRRLLLSNTQYGVTWAWDAIVLAVDGPCKSVIVTIAKDEALIDMRDDRSGSKESFTIVYADNGTCDDDDDGVIQDATAKSVCETILNRAKAYARRNTNPTNEEKRTLKYTHDRENEINRETDAMLARTEVLREESRALSKIRREILYPKEGKR